MYIRNWHIVISGFTQNLSRPSGAEALHFKLRGMVSTDTEVLLRQWRGDWYGMSEYIRRSSMFLPADHNDLHKYRGPNIYIYAYSWGAGNGFTQLAKALRRQGLRVTVAVLCDPVYRSGFIPQWFPDWLQFAPLSLTSIMHIRVPDNVDLVHWFYQRQSRPQGNQLVAKKPELTEIKEGIELHADHVAMDDQLEWHDKAMQVAGMFPKPPSL